MFGEDGEKKALLYAEEFRKHTQDEGVHVSGEFKEKVGRLDEYPFPEDLLLRLELTDTNLDPYDYIGRGESSATFAGFKAFQIKKSWFPDEMVLRNINGYEHFAESEEKNNIIEAVARMSVKWVSPADGRIPQTHMVAFGKNDGGMYYFLECTHICGEEDDNGYFTWSFTRPVDVSLNDETVFVLSDLPVRRTGGDTSTEDFLSVKDAEDKANRNEWESFTQTAGVDVKVEESEPFYGKVWSVDSWVDKCPRYSINYNSALDRTFLRRDDFDGIVPLSDTEQLKDDGQYIILFTKSDVVKLKELLESNG